MIATIITDNYGIVNRNAIVLLTFNAIVLLTFNQKYYGLMLLYEYRLSRQQPFLL